MTASIPPTTSRYDETSNPDLLTSSEKTKREQEISRIIELLKKENQTLRQANDDLSDRVALLEKRFNGSAPDALILFHKKIKQKQENPALIETTIESARINGALQSLLDTPYGAQRTPLERACRSGSAKVVAMFLKAHLEIPGRSPLSILTRELFNSALSNQQKEVFFAVFEFAKAQGILKDLLKANDQDKISPIHHACYLGFAEAVEMLLNTHLEISGLSPLDTLMNLAAKEPLLHFAIWWRQKHATATILEFARTHGILEAVLDTNNESDLLKTPLHEACVSDNPEIITMILNAHLEIPGRSPSHALTIQTSDGRSPLHLAAESKRNNAAIAILDYAISHGVLETILNKKVLSEFPRLKILAEELTISRGQSPASSSTA